MNDPYKNYCRVYDQYIGERVDLPVLWELIKTYHPEAESITEFACGTGEILKHFHSKYDVFGVDISKDMLRVAKTKIPQAELFIGDMRRIRLHRRADVILCVCNSLNHLLRFSDWKLVFGNALRHLNPGGVFIFDINTEASFKSFLKAESMVEESGDDLIVESFSKGPRGSLLIKSRVFKLIRDKDYRLVDTAVTEQTFPLPKIQAALKEKFSTVKLFDSCLDKPTKKSEIIYFVCKI